MVLTGKLERWLQWPIWMGIKTESSEVLLRILLFPSHLRLEEFELVWRYMAHNTNLIFHASVAQPEQAIEELQFFTSQRFQNVFTQIILAIFSFSRWGTTGKLIQDTPALLIAFPSIYSVESRIKFKWSPFSFRLKAISYKLICILLSISASFPAFNPTGSLRWQGFLQRGKLSCHILSTSKFFSEV